MPQPSLQLLVADKWVEAEDVVAFRLVDERGGLLPGFTAGAHIDVHTGADQLRQYSLCNPSHSPTHYEIAVLRAPASRGGSKFMHEELTPGARVVVSQPKNHFSLEGNAPAMLFAGGIGITPILAMAQELDDQGIDFELHYCVRGRERAAFLPRLSASNYSNKVHLHFDDGPESQKLDVASVLSRATGAHHLYVCGPGGFIDHILESAKRANWADQRLHREFFAAPLATSLEGVDGDFELELVRSGRCLNVPAQKSALQVLLEAGIDVPASCEAGVCGTCVTRVIDGIPDHRDVYLTDAEHAANNSFTPCCSRSRSPRLVVDL